jgi:hypothetical protein
MDQVLEILQDHTEDMNRQWPPGPNRCVAVRIGSRMLMAKFDKSEKI